MNWINNCWDEPYKSLINRVLNRIINTFQQFFNSCFSYLAFLFSRVPCDSTLCFVGSYVYPSVCLSVRPSHFTFFGFLRFLSSLLLPKWSSDLKYSSCPPAVYLALFLVACYVTPHPALSVCLFVCLSIHPSVYHVRPSVFPFYFAHPSATILWPRVTCSHSFLFLPMTNEIWASLQKKSLKVPKKVISVQNCMESLFFGGFKALQGALKNAPQHLLKRTDQ